MFDVKVAGENSIIIYFAEAISPELTHKIAFYCQLIKQKLDHLIIDIVPSYTSLFISYRLSSTCYEDVRQLVLELLTGAEYVADSSSKNTIEIPVFYDESVGFDLSDILKDTRLTLAEFIEIHSGQQYQVHAIGFSPGFAFLGQVDQRIARTRLATPRLRIPAGSVGIADRQTAVYPMNSAGGWNIIGRTAVDLSLKDETSLQRFAIGDYVRFKAISKQRYLDSGGKL